MMHTKHDLLKATTGWSEYQSVPGWMVEATVDFWARHVLEVAAALETKGLTLKNHKIRHIGLKLKRMQQKSLENAQILATRSLPWYGPFIYFFFGRGKDVILSLKVMCNSVIVTLSYFQLNTGQVTLMIAKKENTSWAQHAAYFCQPGKGALFTIWTTFGFILTHPPTIQT